MADAANKEATRTYFELVLNRGDMAAADAIFAPDIQFHYPLGDLNGADAVKGYVAAVRTAFPDMTLLARATLSQLVGRWPVRRPANFAGNRRPAIE